MKGLARLSSYSVGLKIVRFALGIGSAALLTRLMPIHDYGIYAYTLVVAALLAIPGEAGMPNLVLREIARARVDDDVPRIRGIVLFANLTVLTLTLAMAIGAGLVLWFAADRIPAIFRWTIFAVMPALLLGALANTRAAVQRALGDPLSSQLPEQIVRPAALIAASVAIWLIVGGRMTAFEGVIGYSIASGVAFIVGGNLLYRTWRTMVSNGPATLRVRQWLGALAPFSAIAGLQVALVQVSAFVLGLTASPTEMATFRVATLGSDFALFSTLAINSLVAPQFAALFHRGATAELETLIGRVNRINVGFALIVTLGLIILGPLALHIGFGPQYAAAYLPMCIVATGHLLGTTMGYVTAIANMTGRERLTMVAAMLGFALNASLSLLLCPRFGALGAAMAAATTAFFWRLGLALYLRRVLGVRAWAFSMTVPAVARRYLPFRTG